MNRLQIIDQRNVLGKEFKIYGDFENPLFLAKDVAEWIEYAYKDKEKGTRNVNMMLQTVDEDEKIKNYITEVGGNNLATQNSHGGMRENTEFWFLTEDGLYEVLMQSRKPIAKEFKKEVKKILKDIRKHGAYATEEVLNNPDTWIAVLTELKSERAKNQRLQLENMVQGQQIAELQPKASYYDLVLSSDGVVSIGVIAKDYGLSAREFNEMLHNMGVQYKQSKVWLLYSKYQAFGYTKTVTHPITHSDGRPGTAVHTYWTQKGRLFLYNLLKTKNIFPVMEREVA